MNITPTFEPQWFYSRDDKERGWPAASREEALMLGREMAEGENASRFVIFQARLVALRDDIFSADDVCERFEDLNEEAWGDDIPDQKALPNGANAELEAALTVTFAAWRAKYQPWEARQLILMSDMEHHPVPAEGTP